MQASGTYAIYLRKSRDYLEAEKYLNNHKLLNAGISTLTDKVLHLNNFIQPKLLEA